MYGIKYDIAEYIDYLKDKNIDIIEDVAQSFQGPEKFNGTPGTRMTLFSLGMIKIQTCFYGGIAVIRDDVELFTKMKKLQDTYPLFTKKMFIKRIIQAFAFEKFINYKLGNNALLLAAKIKGQEREEFYVSLSRGFKPGDNFLLRYRLNPCASLVSFIHIRMA